MLPHATAADYTAFTGTAAPADVERMLAHASEEVDYATATSVYATDTNGLATDTTITGALRDATCAQVQYWQLSGDEHGLTGLYSSVKIGSLALTGKSSTGSVSSTGGLARQAQTILANAGLTPGTIYT